MKRQLALMLMVGALLLTACSANDSGAGFRNPEYGYSVQIPLGWREDRKASGTPAYPEGVRFVDQAGAMILVEISPDPLTGDMEGDIQAGWTEEQVSAGGIKARMFTRPAGAQGEWISNAYLVDGSRHVLLSLRLPSGSPRESYLVAFRSFVASYRH